MAVAAGYSSISQCPDFATTAPLTRLTFEQRLLLAGPSRHRQYSIVSAMPPAPLRVCMGCRTPSRHAMRQPRHVVTPQTEAKPVLRLRQSNFPIGLRMMRRAANVAHTLIVEPFGEIGRDVTRTIIAE